MWVVLAIEAPVLVWVTFVTPDSTTSPSWEKVVLFTIAGINVAVRIGVFAGSTRSCVLDEAQRLATISIHDRVADGVRLDEVRATRWLPS